MNIYKIAKIFSKSFEEPKNEKKQIENFWEDCNETNTNTFSSNIKSNSFDNNNIIKLNKNNINILTTYQNYSKNNSKRENNKRKLSIDSYTFNKNKHLTTLKESEKENIQLTFHSKINKYNKNYKNFNNKNNNKIFNNIKNKKNNNNNNKNNNINKYNKNYNNNNNNYNNKNYINNSFDNNYHNYNKNKSIKNLTDNKKIFNKKKSPSKNTEINDLFLYRYKKARNINNINKIQIINNKDDTFEYIANQINNLSQNYKNSLNINENNLKKIQIKNYVYKKPKILFNLNNLSIKNAKKILNNKLFEIE